MLWKTLQKTSLPNQEDMDAVDQQELLLARMVAARLILLAERQQMLEADIEWSDFFLWFGIEQEQSDSEEDEFDMPHRRFPRGAHRHHQTITGRHPEEARLVGQWLKSQKPPTKSYDGALLQATTMLSSRMSLNPAEETLLFFIWLKARHEMLHQLCSQIKTNNVRRSLNLMEQVFSLKAGSLYSVSHETHVLCRFRLIERNMHVTTLQDALDTGTFLQTLNHVINLDQIDKRPLSEQLDAVCEGICPKIDAISLPPRSFSYVPQLQLLRNHLHEAMVAKRTGLNILLYGAPGVGKTLLASSLAHWMQCDLHAVPVEDDDGVMILPERRIDQLLLGQLLLKNKTNALVLFDEIEDVFMPVQRKPSKAWINQQLEHNSRPTIWLSNQIDMIDPAYLRRFDLILEVPVPEAAALRMQRTELLKALPVTTHFIEWLAGAEWMTPAMMMQLQRLARTMQTKQPLQNEKAMLKLLEQRFKAEGRLQPKDWYQAGVKSTTVNKALLFPAYNPDWLNTNPGLNRVVRQVQRITNARLCLHGYPGTGKTDFAGFLAKQLDRPLLVKSASDLLNMFVGGTEKRVAAMFREAQESHSILLLDEADTFLHARNVGDQRSWEISMVNEMLVQMERFEGLFIATSNRFETMDTAVMRRFDLKVRFDWLSTSQLLALIEQVLREQNGQEPGLDHLQQERLQRLKVSPGNVKTALRRLYLEGRRISGNNLLMALEAEMQAQQQGQKQPIGFVQPGSPVKALYSADQPAAHHVKFE